VRSPQRKQFPHGLQDFCAPQITTNDIYGLRGAEIRCGNVRDSIKADNLIEF
jgi:hypothetical protein